eukprot:6949339-Pyramimonas_sp.AAC.1
MSSMYSSTPSAHRSTAGVYGSASSSSGALYHGVPTTCPPPERALGSGGGQGGIYRSSLDA